MEKIVRFFDNMMNENELADFQQEMAHNPQLKNRVRVLQQLFQHAHPGDLELTSDRIWNWAKAKINTKHALDKVKEPIIAYPRQVVKDIKKALQDLKLGLAPAPSLLGATETNEISYDAGSYQINLAIYGAGQSDVIKLTGEIFEQETGNPVISNHICLSHPNWNPLVTTTDENGSFYFSSVMVSDDNLYELTVDLDESELVIEHPPLSNAV